MSDPALWRRERNHTDTDTGEIHRTRMLNTSRGLLLTLHDGGALQAERSLPKALTGQNVTDLEPWQVPAALEVVDEELEEALGPGLPSFSDWLPVRVDYCESQRLGDEGLVLRTLDRLAGLPLPYKGLPVRGESHSVSWARGAVRPKFYSKYLESRDPAALGVLRREFGVFRAKGLRTVLSAVDGPARGAPLARGVARDRPDLRVVDVLRADVREYVLSRYSEPLRGALMTTKDIGDVALLRELAAYFGPQKAAKLLGWCLLAAAFGAQSRTDMLAMQVGSPRTWYRVVADIREFRVAMHEKGHEWAYEDGEDEVAVFMERVRDLRTAA